jgi:hypothetical protein
MLKKKVYSLLVSLSLSFAFLGLITFPSIEEAEGQITGSAWQHREWSYVYGAPNEMRWIQQGGTTATLTSQGAGRGYVWMWLDFRESWLDGKYLNITFSMTGNYWTKGYIIDTGNYSRTYPPNFKNNSGSDDIGMNLNWGSGLVQTLWTLSGVQPNQERSYLINTAAASSNRVTLVFQIRDNTIIFGQDLFIQRLEVVPASNLSKILWEEEINGTVTYDLPDTNPGRYGTLSLGTDPPNYCQINQGWVQNPSVPNGYLGYDILFTGHRTFWFSTTYNEFNYTRGDNQTKMAFNDGLRWYNLTFTFYGNRINEPDNPEYGLFTIDSGEEGITTISRARGEPFGWLYNEITLELYVAFPVYLLLDKVQDALNVDLYMWCSDDEGWQEDSYIFHIYNQGGWVDGDSPTQGEGTFEMCIEEEDSYTINQYFRKIQRVGLQFAVRFYLNDSGTWRPEDQLMQDADNGHAGSPITEYYMIPGLCLG